MTFSHRLLIVVAGSQLFHDQFIHRYLDGRLESRSLKLCIICQDLIHYKTINRELRSNASQNNQQKSYGMHNLLRSNTLQNNQQKSSVMYNLLKSNTSQNNEQRIENYIADYCRT